MIPLKTVFFAFCLVPAACGDSSFRLPTDEEVFTVAFQTQGERKDTVRVYDEARLRTTLPRMVQVDECPEDFSGYGADASPYRSQDGVLVTTDRRVYSFMIILKEREYLRGKVDGIIRIYSGDGHGFRWFRLPMEDREKN